MKKLLFVLSFLLLNCSQNQESITIDSPNIYTEVKSEISLSIDLLDRTTGTGPAVSVIIPVILHIIDSNNQ